MAEEATMSTTPPPWAEMTPWPNETPQVSSLRAYVNGEAHADHDTFSCGREFAEALLVEYDRVRHLAEVKYELLASERGHDVLDEFKPRIEKLYMQLNAAARGEETDLDGDPVAQWNRLVELTATALAHWMANARWAVLEHRKADDLRDALLNGVDVGPQSERPKVEA